ncbi:DUF6588 family protein [Mucilaginibacter sp. dw_454]|uniref:DUF6588 family protein n=1 Tax=Mucilaginibacter sp. dw_454 TaxID=2720079 RepID=UPI001BD285C9|nr:DUF6588 family protein [Mucilaginibacter sp. dw_454]
MKRLYSFIFIAFLTAVAFNASAQDDGISDLFKGSPGDVNKLINAYANPLFKGFGNSLNGGWTNTAKTQKFLRFVIRISASASMVPSKDKSFDINALGLANIKPTNASQSIAPTFGGDKNLETGITYTDPNNPTAKYSTSLPKGVTQYIPAPQIQLTIGLVKYTDLTIRFIPTTKITDDVGSVGMFGFGLKHDIIQDFIKKGPEKPFDLAIAFGYTRLSYNKTLDVKPENALVTGNTDFSNQRLEGNFNGINASVILSKKILFFTPFVSVGYQKSNTNVSLKGNFPFVTGATNAGTPTYTSYADPITISGSGSSLSGTRADIGFQLSLTVLKIYASYDVSSTGYNSANAGIGLGF